MIGKCFEEKVQCFSSNEVIRKANSLNTIDIRVLLHVLDYKRHICVCKRIEGEIKLFKCDGRPWSIQQISPLSLIKVYQSMLPLKSRTLNRGH